VTSSYSLRKHSNNLLYCLPWHSCTLRNLTSGQFVFRSNLSSSHNSDWYFRFIWPHASQHIPTNLFPHSCLWGTVIAGHSIFCCSFESRDTCHSSRVTLSMSHGKRERLESAFRRLFYSLLTVYVFYKILTYNLYCIFNIEVKYSHMAVQNHYTSTYFRYHNRTGSTAYDFINTFIPVNVTTWLILNNQRLLHI
jgi:hypothetical protein